MRREEKILLWSSNIWNFADGMLGPLFAVFASRIGGNVLDISWAWALYLITTGVCTIVVGKAADKYGHERLMLAGYGLTAVFTFAYLVVYTPLELAIVQIGLGIALALCNPTWSALYARYSGGKHHDGSDRGFSLGDGKIAQGLAILAGGFIVDYFSFAALFWVMGIFQLAAALYTAQILHAKHP